MEQQFDLLSYKPPLAKLNMKGATFDIVLDWERLNKQMRRVHAVMEQGEWKTLRQISDETGYPEASISARLRDYRSNEYLASLFTMESERTPGLERRGVWRYRVRARR